MRKLMIGLIRAYQYLLSPWLGNHCRFYPSCSNYAMECIEVHGPLAGTLMALRRLGCCHPWHEGGHDPVPPKATYRHSLSGDTRVCKPSVRTIDLTGHG
jgi:uncharacterized protein